MKIGILTLPLHHNYGGILQCYALKEILKRMGHDIIVIHLEYNDVSFKRKCFFRTKIVFCKVFAMFGIKSENTFIIDKNTRRFIRKYLTPQSRYVYSSKQIQSEVNRIGLEAIVVGSDQVWHKWDSYMPGLSHYYLDFLTDNSIKRISYAASFGSIDINYSADEIREYSKLLKRFNGISVREESAVGVLAKYFNTDSELVLDPTLLLKREDYVKLLSYECFQGDYIFCYLLNKNANKDKLVKMLALKENLQIIDIMPKQINEQGRFPNDYVFKDVELWIESFVKAKYVVTDSFHGTVFSVIFNKSFISLGNEIGGQARFHSFLDLLGLKDRLVLSQEFNECLHILNKSIDWDDVNTIRERWIDSSKMFLENSFKAKK